MTRKRSQRGKNNRTGIAFHPNLRYGNPAALRGLTVGLSTLQIARILHRHPRTIRDWISERRPVPYWVVELLELRHQAHLDVLRQMGIDPRAQVHALQANRRGHALAGSPAHAVPEPGAAGSAGRPGRGHGRAVQPSEGSE
ncbi:MAG: hypothetical protein WCY32_12405 [Burkholderiaceae bacterium]